MARLKNTWIVFFNGLEHFQIECSGFWAAEDKPNEAAEAGDLQDRRCRPTKLGAAAGGQTATVLMEVL